MSFKNALTDVSICSDALSYIAQAPISSMNDTGLAARECRRHYKRVVATLLEKHHWGLAVKTAALVERASASDLKWLYHYDLPEDAAHVIRLAYPAELTNQSYYGGMRAILESRQQNFAVEGRVLKTNVEGASVDYVSYDITEADFTESLAEAIRLKLASALAMPITKRADMRERFSNEADAWINAAMARERNAQNPTYGDAPSEADYARVGSYDITGGVPRW